MFAKPKFVASFTLVAILAISASQERATAAEQGWLMRSHDARRTGRALVNGPRKGTKVWTYTAIDSNAINIEAAVTSQGIFFGSWGIIRSANAKTDWDKFDGKIYGLDPATGKELWPPLLPQRTPYAYRYDGRKPTEQDKPAGEGMHLNWSNGTIEGAAAVDPQTGIFCIGRGDGYLYAVDPRRGQLVWKFRTFDPARPKDPEGGGEIVGGPLVTSGGTIVCATFAAPHRPNPPKSIRHETNAVYGIDRSGKMLWRYPAKGTLESIFSASPALSPDGKRVYLVNALPDKNFPCDLYALDIATGKLLWKLELGQVGGNDLAVGSDGVLYVAGSEQNRPVAFAVADQRTAGKIIWGPIAVDGIRPLTHWAGGVALFEQGNKVIDVYVSTTGLRELNIKAGRLHRLDPATGKVTATWNPEKAKPSCLGTLTDVTLDKEGVIYVGVRGRWKLLADDEVKGRMYALRRKQDSFEVLWSLESAGQIDWASPAIGPKGGLFFGTSSPFGPIEHSIPRAPNARVPKADSVFYGVRD